MLFRRAATGLLAFVLIACGGASAGRAQAPGSALFEAVRTADLALASIGFRLSVANAPLCDRLEPGHGMQFHTLAQYGESSRGAVRDHFGFAGPLAVEGVVAHSPAERAGVRQDDTIVAIGPVRPTEPAKAGASTDMLAGFVAAVAQLSPDAPLGVDLLRGGQPMHLTIQPVPACRTRYELELSSTLDARANGELVQISSAYYDRVGADLLPAVVAHELAHNILRHRVRLNERGADFGLASGFGSNVGYFRQAELQADILSVYLLKRAGYAPDLPVHFWNHKVTRGMSGFFRSRSHPGRGDRLKAIHAEIARLRASGTALPEAPFVAQRDTPLDGEWKPLIPGKGR